MSCFFRKKFLKTFFYRVSAVRRSLTEKNLSNLVPVNGFHVIYAIRCHGVDSK